MGNKSMSRVIPIAVLALSTLAFAQQAPPPPQPLSIDGAATHVYKSVGGVELRLHVFAAAGAAAAPRPAIVFFFGGGWRTGSIAQFVPHARHLSERGMVAIVADYRVSGRHRTTPFDAIADAKSAIRWVRAHAKELRVDPARIAAGGGSAGGHLAATAATLVAFDEASEDQQVSSKPNALVLFNPALDTSDATLAERFGGKGREASPLHQIRAGLPPTVIFHGKADTTVPYASVERYCEAATTAGNQCQLFGYDGATHGFFNRGRDGDKWYEETVREMDRFLMTLGYLRVA
jgi:acetyl esterase/lipase